MTAPGCGGDDETTAGSTSTQTAATRTTSVGQQTVTASTQPERTTTTTTQAAATRGADDPVNAAAAVLTTQGTVEQACDLYVTASFIQTAYGGKQNCVESRAGGLARSMTVLVAKGNLHLVVIPHGGPYDGAKVEVELVHDAGGYRVDSLEAHVPAGP